MRWRARSLVLGLAAPSAAAIGCLQPGIDPVFLALLTHANGLPAEWHGLVVGATQGGAALGALAVWRLGAALPHRAVMAAALFAIACSLLTPLAGPGTATLAVRGGYGTAMGVVYAHAMGAYAARAPNRAYAAVYLAQLLIATLASALLPEAGLLIGEKCAIALLALAPACAFLALLATKPTPDSPRGEAHRAAIPLAGWALAAATFWFICATMLVWSFTAALAGEASLSDPTIGHAVAIGSVVGVLTAIAVMRESRIVPMPLTAILSLLGLASPLAMTRPGEDGLFILSVILLNIGSTAIIIRCSGMASAASMDSRFRTFVACTHALGTIAGPLAGSALTHAFGLKGLPAGVAFAGGAGVAMVVLASLRAANPFSGQGPRPPSQMRKALD